jgi:hypothetical protein
METNKLLRPRSIAKTCMNRDRCTVLSVHIESHLGACFITLHRRILLPLLDNAYVLLTSHHIHTSLTRPPIFPALPRLSNTILHHHSICDMHTTSQNNATIYLPKHATSYVGVALPFECDILYGASTFFALQILHAKFLTLPSACTTSGANSIPNIC